MLLRMYIINILIIFSSHFQLPGGVLWPFLDIFMHIYFIYNNGTGSYIQYAGKLFGDFRRLHHGDPFQGAKPSPAFKVLQILFPLIFFSILPIV
ncbi:MAG: hypothetical protein ABIN89_24210 [Chitinophagaceae bacterium]